MRNLLRLVALWAAFSSLSGISYAGTRPSLVRHQYPVSNAVEVQQRTNIGIRAGSAYDAGSLQEGTLLIEGSKSGVHTVNSHLSRDRQTLIIHTLAPFALDEQVHVLVSVRLLGGQTLTDSFSFSTMRRVIPKVQPVPGSNQLQSARSESALSTSGEDTLPPITISVDNGATPGTIYLANYSVVGVDSFSYLLNLDEHGNIVRKRNLSPSYGLDFKEQPNGLRTYFDYNAGKYYGMDTAWNVVDSFEVADGFTDDGYNADDHELRVFADGGFALFAVTRTSLDQSQWAANIDTQAVIQGSVIQIFDADKNEIFEWRGQDNFKISDAIHENLLANVIDFEHANSLDFDSLGNIILSNRNLSEVTKIDGGTGDIIWRFGGEHNQFKLIGDSIWFSYQHAVRLLPNGHLTMFDNSDFDSVIGGSGYITNSRAVEYALDTVAMTATLVWQWHHTPETFSMSMGYVERLPNGNTLIGWGWGVSNGLAVTEVRPDNSTAFEMSMGAANYSYRAIKYPSLDTASSASSGVNHSTESGNSLSIQQDIASSTVSANIELSTAQQITITVFDLLGRQVIPSLSLIEPGGSHSLSLQAQNLQSGAYYCDLRVADGSTMIRPFTIAR